MRTKIRRPRRPGEIDADWVHQFDLTLRRYYRLCALDVPIGEDELKRLAALGGRDAALAYADEHDLEPVGWWDWNRR